jgi:hypothetical protein
MHSNHRALSIAGSSAMLALLVFVSPAASQVTAEEAACRSKLSKGFAKFMKATTKSIASCHKLRNKGDVLAATDCNDPVAADSQTGAKAAGAYSKWQSAVNDACAAVPTVLDLFATCPAPLDTDDDLGATTDIDTYDEALSCLTVHARAAIVAAAETALGAPTPPLAADASKCHNSIAKGFAKTIDAILKYRNQCQAASDKSGGTLGFDCFTTDNDAKIALTADKAGDGIEKSCVTSVALADSCATTAAAIETCAIDEAALGAADTLSPLLWELKGVCPGYITLALGASLHEPGWSGMSHGEEPVGGYDLFEFPLACNSNCTSCSGTPAIVGDHCRCIGDSSESCSANGDCASFGGECRCYWAPPTPTAAVGNYPCLLPAITSVSAGSVVPTSGDTTVDVDLALRLYAGGTYERPCPTCEANVCVGGPRNGLSCSIDATDPVLGDTSLDCIPSQGNNISGTGVPFRLQLTTGDTSLPFNVPCDSPNGGLMCACSSCSLDNSIACNADSTCAAAGAGVCRTDGGHGGTPRRPNSCDDLVCTPIPGNEGVCAAGPSNAYCDGFLRDNGRGVVPCSIQGDCDLVTCAGGSCGTCSHFEVRKCFPDPVETSGTNGETLAGTSCMPASASPAMNIQHGWPGPFRLRQDFSLHSVMCPDGVTPYRGPGGSNCP